MSKEKIIVVDDEAGIRQLVKTFLERQHYEVHEAETGAALFERLKTVKPNLILLDLMLPDMYGIDICKKIRETSDVPIIMLTAVQGETNTVLGFEAGADDYVEKPFSSHVLLSRIQAILKRRSGGGDGANAADDAHAKPFSRKDFAYKKAVFGSWNYLPGEDCIKHISGRHMFLTKQEAALLEVFLLNENRILTRDDIAKALHIDVSEHESRAIDVQISRLRTKLKDRNQSNFIKSIRNKGYLFIVPVRLVE